LELDAAKRMPNPKYLIHKQNLFGQDDGKENDEILAINYDGKAYY
jgi:hypothetical protein